MEGRVVDLGASGLRPRAGGRLCDGLDGSHGARVHKPFILCQPSRAGRIMSQLGHRILNSNGQMEILARVYFHSFVFQACLHPDFSPKISQVKMQSKFR